MRVIALLLLGTLFVGGCGGANRTESAAADPDGGSAGDDASEPQEFDLSSIAPPPPVSLHALAMEVRAAGGHLSVGRVGPAADAPPERVQVMADVWLEYPRVQANISVDDDLGDDTAETLLVLASSGEAPTLTDASGAPADGWVASGSWSVDPHRLLTPEGVAVWFIAGENLIWRAALEGSLVSGEGTSEGTHVTLDDLRIR